MAKLTKYSENSIDPMKKIEKLFKEVSDRLDEHKSLILAGGGANKKKDTICWCLFCVVFIWLIRVKYFG